MDNATLAKLVARALRAERQSSGWPRAFKIAGLDFPGYPIKPAPMPSAEVPAKAPLILVDTEEAPAPPHPKQEVHETHESDPESGPREVALPFGEALAAERKAQKLSQEAVGTLVGTSQTAVSSWEAGKPRALPLDGLRRAARALGITGPISVVVDDAASEVIAGASTWRGVSPDEAVETARAELDRRLREKRDEMIAALNALGGA